jgi:hypothetical protein
MARGTVFALIPSFSHSFFGLLQSVHLTQCAPQGAGFDPRLANWAEVGKGAYFSQHVMYGYAYKNKLWDGGAEPAVGETMSVFVALVCLGNIADMGPGCETCPSPSWDEWKKEFDYMKSPQNPSPKPTRPPLMTLPLDPAEHCHITQLLQAS